MYYILDNSKFETVSIVQNIQKVPAVNFSVQTINPFGEAPPEHDERDDYRPLNLPNFFESGSTASVVGVSQGLSAGAKGFIIGGQTVIVAEFKQDNLPSSSQISKSV